MTNSMHGGRSGWLMREKWYVLEDNEIGGWAVANADVGFTSNLNYTNDDRSVAGFVSKEHAEHIVQLHNEWLEGQ